MKAAKMESPINPDEGCKREYAPKALAQAKLADWLDIISRKYQLWVPQDQGGVSLLAPYQLGRSLSLERTPKLSAKEVLFPQTECLLKYEHRKDSENVEKISLSPSHPPHPNPLPNGERGIVVFGIPPCDVSGINLLGKVWAGDGYQDPYFNQRRSQTVIVALACQHPASTCFCTAVGGSPVSAPGTDLLLHKVDNGYLIDILAPKGAELVEGDLFQAVGEEEIRAMDQAESEIEDYMTLPFKLKSLPATSRKLLDAFGADYWKEATRACLSCGICTYVCPTCYCFNIADEDRGMCGERLRCWDSCIFPGYTLEASGHNPRREKSQRYRNRLCHKFSYLITNNQTLGCTGCGRCIRECPAGIDLRSILAHILGEER